MIGSLNWADWGPASPRRRGAHVAFSAAVVVSILIAAVAYRATRGLESAVAMVAHTQRVQGRLEELLSTAQAHTLSTRGFALTGDERFLIPEATADATLRSQLSAVAALTRDDAAQQQRLAQLKPLLQALQAWDHEVIATRRAQGLNAATTAVSGGEGTRRLDRVSDAVAELIGEEDRLLGVRTAALRTGQRRVLGALALLVVAVFAAIASAWAATGRELRARQRAAERLDAQRLYAESIVHTVREPLLVLDAALRVVSANRAFYRTFGGIPAQTESRFIHELGGGEWQNVRLRTVLEEVLPGDRAVENFEVSHELPGLGERTLRLHARRLEGGEHAHILLAIEDITERRRAERLEVERRALEHTNRELKEFAYVASHDLQEPLRKIRAFAERLTVRHAAALPAEVRDYLQRMERSAHRMQTLIENLLAFARVTTRAQPFTPVDLRAMAQEVVSDLEPSIDATGARIEVGALPAIEADPTQMRQLLQNLVANALKFHRPDAPPVVQLGATLTGPRATWCELTVADNGIGFDEKYLDRIFTIFQRLHGRDEYEGTGLGLAICRKIVERHGGRITARSAPGRGATFVVTLPTRGPAGQEAA